MLDSAATLNCVSKEAAKEVYGRRKPTSKMVGVLKTVQQVTESIEMKIKIGDKEDTITAYVVDGIPGDIIIGSPFLSKHSEGYHKMIEEFKGNPERRRICAVTELDELNKLLQKYPKLILKEDELPDPTRYYKARTFRLGLPEEKRDKIYYRPQYHVDETLIDEFRKLLQPLIDAGVYRE